MPQFTEHNFEQNTCRYCLRGDHLQCEYLKEWERDNATAVDAADFITTYPWCSCYRVDPDKHHEDPDSQDTLDDEDRKLSEPSESADWDPDLCLHEIEQRYSQLRGTVRLLEYDIARMRSALADKMPQRHELRAALQTAIADSHTIQTLFRPEDRTGIAERFADDVLERLAAFMTKQTD